LEQVAFALLILVAIAVAVVRLGKHDLGVNRDISPERARAEQPVTVALTVHNRGRGTTPLVLLDDRLPLELPGRARFTLHGIEPDGHRQATYTVRPPRRGRYELGPLNITFVDPFGLARLRGKAVESSGFLAHPRIEMLTLPRDPSRQRSHAVSALRQLTGARGEDFYTMREYAHGDDLRKIHWPSTAKRQKPMIRQEETPWHTRATVVIDDRAAPYAGFSESPFERVVEATASIVDLYSRSGYSFRLMGAHDPGVPSARGSDQLWRCLDRLAVIAPVRDAPDALAARLAALESTPSAEGALFLVTGTLSGEIVARLIRCSGRFKQVIVVSFPAHRFGSAPTKRRWEGERQTVEAVRMLSRTGGNVLVLGPEDSLTSGWASLSRTPPRGGDGSWERKPELV
jgi:uncharacterized protein (DUF58 family)